MFFTGQIERAAAVALLVLILSFSGLRAAQDVENIPITRHEVSKDVFLYQAGQTAAFPNMIAIRTSAGTVVFDALMSPALAKRVKDMIEKDFGGKIACLINTHGAIDHTGGNPAFKDVPIYGHANIKTEMDQMSQVMARWATNPPAAPSEKTKKLLEEVKRNYRGDLREFGETDRMMGFLDPRHPPEMVVPATLIGDSYDLTVGDKTFHMFHNTPSYSESDIVTFVPELKTLIVGDVFNANRIPLLSAQGTDLDAWAKLFAPYIADNSKVEHFIGTHGAGILTAAEIREQFQYLTKLSEEVKNLKASGKSAAEIQAVFPLDKFPYLSKYNPFFYGTTQNVHAANIAALWAQAK